MLYFEYNFEDGTGVRIVTVPHEDIKREVVEIQFRVSVQGKKPRIAKCPLFDKDKKLDLFPVVVDALLQDKIKEIGKQCQKCEKYYLPISPAQKICKDCHDAAEIQKEDS